MKRITATALFTLAALVTAGGAMAQGRAVRATVPFDFTVGDKLLPAGNYEVSKPSSSFVEIQNRDNHATALTTTTYSSHDSRQKAELVFNRYGNQYFLSEVLCETASINVTVPPSKLEKRARMQEAALHNTSQVFVALK